MDEMTRRIFWWDFVVGVVLAFFLLTEWGIAYATSPSRVLYLGQEVLLPDQISCHDMGAAVELAESLNLPENPTETEVRGVALKAYQTYQRFNDADRCHHTVAFMVRIGDLVYKNGPTNVIAIASSNHGVLYYVVTTIPWSISLET